MAKTAYEATKTLKNIFGEAGRGIDLRYRKYRFHWVFAPRWHYVTKFPQHLDIEVTTNCNLRCDFCYIRDKDLKGAFIDFELFKKIIDEGSKYKLNSIKLNWRGEPTVHPRLVDMVKYAKEKGVLEVQFNTNGTLLNGKLSEELIDAGLDRIIFSVDGATKETYEKIRKGANYEILLKNIAKFVEMRGGKGRKKPFTRIQMVETDENKHEVDQFVEMWAPLIDEVCVNPLIEGVPSKDIVKGRKACSQLWQRLTISFDGKVMMCCGDWRMREILGDANKDSIYDIWHGKRLNEIRALHQRLEHHKINACRDCVEWETYELK